MFGKIAYGLLFLGMILKTSGLYFLAGRKDLPFEQRKRKYNFLNWPGNILLVAGVVILLLK